MSLIKASTCSYCKVKGHTVRCCTNPFGLVWRDMLNSSMKEMLIKKYATSNLDEYCIELDEHVNMLWKYTKSQLEFLVNESSNTYSRRNSGKNKAQLISSYLEGQIMSVSVYFERTNQLYLRRNRSDTAMILVNRFKSYQMFLECSFYRKIAENAFVQNEEHESMMRAFHSARLQFEADVSMLPISSILSTSSKFNIVLVNQRIYDEDTCESFECDICYETFKLTSQVTTGCNHSFCCNCILKTMQCCHRANKPLDCAMCRTKYNTITTNCPESNMQLSIYVNV